MTTSVRPASVSLYYRNGKSDKVYQAAVEPQGDGFIVTYAYGRRGATLTTGTKTTEPVNYETALAAFERLVREKTSKGYTEDTAGTPYEYTDKSKDVSGLLPQLLNVATNGEVLRALADDAWVMQEKFDGRRMMLRKAGTVEGVNKLGLVVPVAKPLADAARSIDGDFTIDGEAVGDVFYAFDLLSLDGDDVTELPYVERHAMLRDLLPAGGPIAAVESWADLDSKKRKLAALKDGGAEGVVFKHGEAPYRAGRPSSGGTQLKFKFVETLSAVVTAVNEKRSVGVGLLFDGELRFVGDVAIPVNRDVPAVGTVVEVRYLYAFKPGQLYQPVYLGVRDDIREDECVASQMKFKSN